jgi:hypothetical protein
MAKIYNAPNEVVKLPIFDWKDMTAYRQAEEKYLQELKEFCLKRKKGKNIGEVIQFPCADGYALYMVASMKPLELIHIPLGDAYSFQYADRLKAIDIEQKIEQGKRIAEMFANKK